MTTTVAEQTLGEARVRISFNPSGNSMVEDIKRRAADCIDWCNDERERVLANGGGAAAQEAARLYALAMTHFEDAAMWAVKAATA